MPQKFCLWQHRTKTTWKQIVRQTEYCEFARILAKLCETNCPPPLTHTHTFSFQLTTHSKLANIVVANSLSYLVALWSLTCIVCLRIACQTLLDCPYYIATSYPTGIVAPQWMKQQQQQHNLLASNLVQFRIAEIFVNSYKRTNGEKCRPHSSAA